MYAIYIDSGQISGAEKRALKLCHGLNFQGTPCKILMPKNLFDLFSKTEYSGYLNNCLVTDNELLRRLRRIRRARVIRKHSGFDELLKRAQVSILSRIIRNQKISVLHVFLSLDFYLFEGVRKKTGIKILFEITSPDYVKHLSARKESELRIISHFNAVSDSTYINAKKFIENKKLSKAPIAFFSPIEHPVNYNNIFDKKENIIVFAHRLIPRKNGLLFAKVMKSFLAYDLDWKVKILGEGPQSAEIDELLSAEIAAGKVHTGFQHNILPELEKSKIFVSIIQPDNYPSQSVLEAMYTCNSLLLSDRGFTKERFLNNNGYVCEIDFEDILDKLLKLVQDEAKLKFFGQNSLNLLREKFVQSIYLSYITQTYESLNGSKVGVKE